MIGCTALAAELGEPLAATASRFRHWLMLEQPGPWGHDALLESDLPREVGQELRERGERHGVRVLLIRRRDRDTAGSRRVFAAFTGRRERRLVSLEVGSHADLLDLDIGALVDARWAGLGREETGPLFLVCTHGKHDPCCARFGGPAARTIAAHPGVWECTHVGGDRFAGNLVAFPHGLYFGRVGTQMAPRVVEAYERGRIMVSHFRGRSSYARAAQAGEIELRRRTGIDGVDDLVLQRHEVEDGLHRVSFGVPGGRWTVELRETQLPERLLTCKAEHPHSPRGFAVERVL